MDFWRFPAGEKATLFEDHYVSLSDTDELLGDSEEPVIFSYQHYVYSPSAPLLESDEVHW